jgi:hypothetical protein
MEPIHPLLASTRRGVNQQANREDQSDPGANLNLSRLSGSRGVIPFLKVTAPASPLMPDFESALRVEVEQIHENVCHFRIL